MADWALAVEKWREISSSPNWRVASEVSLTIVSISIMPSFVALPIDSLPLDRTSRSSATKMDMISAKCGSSTSCSCDSHIG